MIEYDPFSLEVMTDPLPAYRALRDAGRAYALPRYDAWALSHFDDVWQVLQDRERFSIAEGPIFGRDRVLRANTEPPSTDVARPIRTFSTIDPPVHTKLRRAMLAPFLPRAVAQLETDVRAHTRALLDELVARGRFDAVGDLGSPIAAAATCRVLGLAVRDLAALVRLVNTITRRVPGEPGISAAGRGAQVELHELLTAFAADARDRHGLVDMLAAYDTGDDTALSDSEIAVQLATLLVGGTETLPKIVAGGLLRLSQHPHQRAALAADPSLATDAFEEVMRLEAVLQWVGRTLLVDAEIAGQQMRAGQRVFLLLVSANHDEGEFLDPERFDIRRRFSRSLVFGHGVHVCIGAHAARLVGRVMLQEVLACVPAYRIDPTGIERPPSEFQIGYTAMPVMC